MANYTDLKTSVAAVIKTNGNQEITGQILQNVLNSVISNLGTNATYAGIATPTTIPGNPDGNLFYIAATPGIYVNFNGYELTNKIVVFTNNTGTWVATHVDLYTGAYINYGLGGLGNILKIVLGGINKTPQNWINGYVRPDGTLGTGYRLSEFIPVVPGKTYYAVVSGSNGTLVVSAYSSNSQDSFIAGSPINIVGSATDGVVATLRVITIPAGVNYIRIGASERTPIDAVGLVLKERTGIYDDIQDIVLLNNIIENQSHVIKDKQLVKSADFIAGGFISINSGNVSTSSTSYQYTDFIPVISGQVYKIVGGASGNGGCCFYDKYKVYHNDYRQGTNPTFTIPANCYYMRLSALLSVANPSATLQDDTYKSNKELEDEIKKDNGLINPALNNVFITEGSAETLDDAYHTTTRRRMYDAIKNIKLYGLDETKKHTLYVLWDLRSEDNLFSFRISEYNESRGNWVVALELSGEQVATINAPLGTETVNVKVNGKGVYANAYCIVDIDLSLVPKGTSRTFNALTATPEYIFSKNCYYKESDTPTIETYVPKTIRLYPNTKLPVISFQFDDIPTNDEQVVSLFDEYGLTCGFAFIARDGNMESKAAKYYEWQKRGYQILNHSINGTIFNTTNYTYETALATVMQAKNTLEKYGFVVNGWVSPSSAMADEFMPIIKLTHAYAATKNDEYINGRQSNPCSLTRYPIESNTIANIKAQIDSYISNDKALTFYGHAASFGTEYSGEVWNIDKIRSIIEYCIEKRNAGLCYLGGCDDAMKYYFDL